MIAENHNFFEGLIESIMLLLIIHPTSIFLFPIIAYRKIALSSVMWEVCVVEINLLQMRVKSDVQLNNSVPTLKLRLWLFLPVAHKLLCLHDTTSLLTHTNSVVSTPSSMTTKYSSLWLGARMSLHIASLKMLIHYPLTKTLSLILSSRLA